MNESGTMTCLRLLEGVGHSGGWAEHTPVGVVGGGLSVRWLDVSPQDHHTYSHIIINIKQLIVMVSIQFVKEFFNTFYLFDILPPDKSLKLN